MNSTNENRGIRIYSIEANSLYCVNNNIKFYGGREPFLDLGDAVLPESLFSEYIRNHGATINSRNRTLDFVSICFGDGVKIYDEEDRKRGYKNIKASTLRNEY